MPLKERIDNINWDKMFNNENENEYITENVN
jgi:hypothetical protein